MAKIWLLPAGRKILVGDSTRPISTFRTTVRDWFVSETLINWRKGTGMPKILLLNDSYEYFYCNETDLMIFDEENI